MVGMNYRIVRKQKNLPQNGKGDDFFGTTQNALDVKNC